MIEAGPRGAEIGMNIEDFIYSLRGGVGAFNTTRFLEAAGVD